MSTKKVVILTIPFSGHINPISCMALGLTQKNVDVVFYGLENQKDMIEKTGSRFKLFSYYPTDSETKIKKDNNGDVNDIIEGMYFIDVSNRILNELITMIDEEKPDLVLYDILAVPAKYLLKYLNNRNTPVPAISINTTFQFQENVYPNQIEEGPPMPEFKHNLKSWYYLMLVHLKQISFSFKYGFSIDNPYLEWFAPLGHENLVTTFPELQPRSHLLDNSNHFIGACITENVRKINSNPIIEKILENFDPINPYPLSIENYFLSDDYNKNTTNTNVKLIYVSLGTVFNNNIDMFVKLIDGIKQVNQDKAKSFEIESIIACGKEVVEKINEKVLNKKYEIPSNICIVDFAPQIEILKRASLFISHCGMNSTSESIKYGVPILCVPLMYDQPKIAYRVSDDLGLGIRLDPSSLDKDKVCSGVMEILNDKSYLERILRFSEISKKYDGPKNAANFIYKFLQKQL